MSRNTAARKSIGTNKLLIGLQVSVTNILKRDGEVGGGGGRGEEDKQLKQMQTLLLYGGLALKLIPIAS